MHISIDIESYGDADDAQITQVSAVAFELNGKVQDPHELLQLDDRWMDACIAPYYGAREPGALNFWASVEAYEAAKLIEAQPKVDLDDALGRLTDFVHRWLGKRGCVWAKPPGFDCRLLRYAYGMETRMTPWSRSQEMDMRALIWTARKVPRVHFKVPEFTNIGLTRHYALHDAVMQACTMQGAFRALGLFADDRLTGSGI